MRKPKVVISRQRLMRKLAVAWHRHRWLLLSFVGASLIMVFFVTRMIVAAVYWSDPARQRQTLEGWMTPGYVARSWDVPREQVLDMLGDALAEGRGRTLAQIAQDSGVPLAQILDQLASALAAQRSPE